MSYPRTAAARVARREAFLATELNIARMRAATRGLGPRCASGEHAKCDDDGSMCLCEHHDIEGDQRDGD